MAEFAAATDDLREDLLAMTHTEMLFAKQPWVAELDGTPFAGSSTTTSPTGSGHRYPARISAPSWAACPPAGWGPQLGPPPAGIVKSLPKLPPARRGLRANPSSMLTLDP